MGCLGVRGDCSERFREELLNLTTSIAWEALGSNSRESAGIHSIAAGKLDQSVLKKFARLISQPLSRAAIVFQIDGLKAS
jgi:hypothetical protein